MRSNAIRNILLIAFAALIYVLSQMGGTPVGKRLTGAGNETSASDAYTSKQSDLQMQGKGVVVNLLPDDLKGSKHQKFILKISQEQTVLVSHNIDIAERVKGLQKGDTVEFYGEYEWNAKGGVIHWTHFAPDGNHIHGWLRHNGKTYQ